MRLTVERCQVMKGYPGNTIEFVASYRLEMEEDEIAWKRKYAGDYLIGAIVIDGRVLVKGWIIAASKEQQWTYKTEDIELAVAVEAKVEKDIEQLVNAYSMSRAYSGRSEYTFPTA